MNYCVLIHYLFAQKKVNYIQKKHINFIYKSTLKIHADLNTSYNMFKCDHDDQ